MEKIEIDASFNNSNKKNLVDRIEQSDIDSDKRNSMDTTDRIEIDWACRDELLLHLESEDDWRDIFWTLKSILEDEQECAKLMNVTEDSFVELYNLEANKDNALDFFRQCIADDSFHLLKVTRKIPVPEVGTKLNLTRVIKPRVNGERFSRRRTLSDLSDVLISRNLKHVREVQLESCFLTSADCPDLKNFFELFPNLETIDFSGNFLEISNPFHQDDPTLTLLKTLVRTVRTVRIINLEGNCLATNANQWNIFLQGLSSEETSKIKHDVYLNKYK
jgi:hypothetical protein